MGSTKRLLKQAFRSLGYAVRDVGTGVAGIDLLHDACVLLGASPSPTLFDVGANIGQTTLAMLDAFRSPKIRAFEPSPKTYEILKQAVAGKQGVTAEKIAMGDAKGVAKFHVTRDHSVNDSLLAPTWEAGGSIIEVPVETVDGYCEREKVDRIDLLKVDAQGYDLRVLRGARRMLEGRKVAAYCCESNFEPLYESQPTLRDALAFADEVGYKLVGFYEQTYVKNRLSYLDALFVAP